MRRQFSWLSPSLLAGSLGILAVACTPEAAVPNPSQPGDGSGSSGGKAKRELPCDVAEIVDEHCGLCHGTKPAYSAPMPLVTRADFRAKSEGGDPYYKLALERIHHEKPKYRMPPVSQDEVPEAELDILDAWLNDGAPKSTEKCGGDSDDGDNDDVTGNDDDDTGNGDNTGDDDDTGNGDEDDLPEDNEELGIYYDPIKPEDCEMEIELRAFEEGKNNKENGFPVGTQKNSYECFDFEVPYDGKMQALEIAPIIDNEEVVHHWLVYDASGTTKGKSYYNCAGIHPAAQLLAGWAAGRGATTMPRGVGLKLPEKSSGRFTLELHYNNPNGTSGIRDRSGAKVCATSKLRKNEAAVAWLGTEAIVRNLFSGPKQEASGTCSVNTGATILNSWPHMHYSGVRMTARHNIKGGGQSMIFDKPFSFDDQVSYDTPLRVAPGDSITTTCYYELDARTDYRFGTESEAEMCYNYVLHYPAGALYNGVSLTGVTGTCLF